MRRLSPSQREAIRTAANRFDPTICVAVDAYGQRIGAGDTVMVDPFEPGSAASHGGNRYTISSVRPTAADRLVFTSGHCVDDARVVLVHGAGYVS